MSSKGRKAWMHQEEIRLTKYQHQHRGLSFRKLLLPPVTDRKVSLVGRDNHIYRGSIPRIPEDQLPPEVDEASIDEESLYKEIRDMNFPPVPEQEPLGPSRRIGGEYTLAKKLTLAPVQVECTKGLEETLILGRDGGIYRGKEKYPSKIELDKQLRGTKRSVQKVRTSSNREFVEPSLVLLQTSSKPLLNGKGKKSLIELPTTEIGKIIGLIREKSVMRKNVRIIDTTNQNEAIGSEEEEFQSDEESEKSKESEMREERNTEEQEETDDVENPEETDSEESEETDMEESTETEESEESKESEMREERTAEEQEETDDTENPEETDVEAPTETEEALDVEAPTETEEALNVEETKDIAEESDL